VLNVKKTFLIAAIAVAAICVGPALRPVAAQAPAPGGQRIAVVDISAVFKAHPGYNQAKADMIKDIKASNAELERQLEGLKQLSESLQQFHAGTQEYKKAEADIVNEKSRLTAKRQLEQKEFQQREATIYYNVYQEILQEVQYICRANGISLVMNVNRKPVDKEKQEDILRGLTQPVVYSSPELDITPLVLQRISPNGQNGTPTADRDNRPTGVYAPRR